MNIPQIQITTQKAQIAVTTEQARQEIEQPGPEVSMNQKSSQLEISRIKRGLEIDQERAWDALALGKNTKVMSKIYSMASDIAMRGIARRIEEGRQIGNLLYQGNVFADISKNWRQRFPEFDFRGVASPLNVDISYTQDDLRINFERGGVQFDVKVNHPVHRYEAGRVNIYMQQWPSIDITVDLTV